MVPVMLMGVLIGGARYTPAQCAQTLLVGGGVGLFAFFKGSAKALAKLQDANAPLGYALCGANLLLDGYTNAYQDFGSLACVTVTTTRKLANILLSVAVNRTPLRAEQWGAVALVFAGLAWNIRDKQARAAADDARLAQKKEG
eukprot:PRCOL_00006449-RA